MKVKDEHEMIESAADIAAEFFSCEKKHLTQKQLDFVLMLVLGASASEKVNA